MPDSTFKPGDRVRLSALAHRPEYRNLFRAIPPDEILVVKAVQGKQIYLETDRSVCGILHEVWLEKTDDQYGDNVQSVSGSGNGDG